MNEQEKQIYHKELHLSEFRVLRDLLVKRCEKYDLELKKVSSYIYTITCPDNYIKSIEDFQRNRVEYNVSFDRVFRNLQ